MPEPTTVEQPQSIQNKLLSSQNPIWEKTKQLGQQELEKAKEKDQQYKEKLEQDEIKYSQNTVAYEEMNTDDYKAARTKEIQSTNAEVPLKQLQNEISQLASNIKDEIVFVQEINQRFENHPLAAKFFAGEIRKKVIALEPLRTKHKKVVAGEFNAEIKSGELPQDYDKSVDFFSKTHAIVVANHYNLITTEELGTNKTDLQRRFSETGVHTIKTAQNEIVNGQLYSRGKELINKNKPQEKTSDLNKWLIEEIDGMNNMSQVISGSIKQYGETVYPINEFYLFQQRLNKLKNQIISINSSNLESSDNQKQVQAAFVQVFGEPTVNKSPQPNAVDLTKIQDKEKTETPKFIAKITELLKRTPKSQEQKAA